MRSRIRTDDRLYLHFDQGVPKVLVVADDTLLADEYRWDMVGLPVVLIETDKIEYDDLHRLLHELVGNVCQGRKVEKPYRTKKGSEYGRIIRYGNDHGDDRNLNGCWDLPLFDVDAIEVEDDCVIALVELKYPGERLTEAQRKVMRNARKLGIEYLEGVNDGEED